MPKKIVNKKVTESSRMCVHDFTYHLSNQDEGYDYRQDVDQMRKALSPICKKYTFQLEKGEKTGKLHFQGRISLKEKTTKKDLGCYLIENNGLKMHLSVTSNENRKNDFYVTKESTRLDGPFTDKNHIELPWDVALMVKLRPWQESMKEELLHRSERGVDVIVDEKGNVGKTRFCRYMMCHHEAQILPFSNDYRDIMRMSYDVGPKAIYMIDIPRAMPKKKLMQLFSAIETLKSGYCYDDRNTFRQRIFNPPRILVFMNKYPDISSLSSDMWHIWNINARFQLLQYQFQHHLHDSTESSEQIDSYGNKYKITFDDRSDTSTSGRSSDDGLISD